MHVTWHTCTRRPPATCLWPFISTLRYFVHHLHATLTVWFSCTPNHIHRSLAFSTHHTLVILSSTAHFSLLDPRNTRSIDRRGHVASRKAGSMASSRHTHGGRADRVENFNATQQIMRQKSFKHEEMNTQASSTRSNTRRVEAKSVFRSTLVHCMAELNPTHA